MKVVKHAYPPPSEGIDYSKEVDQVVPDQSLSLEEILHRFTRGESLPVGMETQDGYEDENPLNIDLEKLANSDLVDKEEFIGKLKALQHEYNVQEKKKAEQTEQERQKEFAKKDAARIKRAAQKLAKDNLAK